MSNDADQGRPRPAFWRSFAAFAELGPDALGQVAAGLRRRTWAAGSVLFQRGDPGDWMLALAKGRVRLTRTTPGGRDLVLRHAEPGETLGELAIFDGAPRSADATALTAIEGWVLARTDWDRLARADPTLARAALHWACARLRETTDQLETVALYDLEARVARFLLAALRQINGDDLPDQAALRIEISQSEIAAVLGATRPKVNRALAALEESGVTRRNDGVTWCDVPGLKAVAEGPGG